MRPATQAGAPLAKLAGAAQRPLLQQLLWRRMRRRRRQQRPVAPPLEAVMAMAPP
jgi:hypothetical protein